MACRMMWCAMCCMRLWGSGGASAPVAPLWRDLHLDRTAALVVRRRVCLRDVFQAVAVRDAAAQALGVAAHNLDGCLVVGLPSGTAVAVRSDDLRLLDKEHD